MRAANRRPSGWTPFPPIPAAGAWVDLTPSVAAPILAGVRVIDVREPHEFYGDLGHLPGAELIPLGGLEAAVERLRPEAPVLVVCRSGGRAGRACDLLVASGLQAVYNLAGGMLAWNGEGRSACASPHGGTADCCDGAGRAR